MNSAERSIPLFLSPFFLFFAVRFCLHARLYLRYKNLKVTPLLKRGRRWTVWECAGATSPLRAVLDCLVLEYPALLYVAAIDRDNESWMFIWT